MAIKATITADVLPRTNVPVPARNVRYTSGVCAGCDVMIDMSEISVQLDSDNRACLPHPSCHVVWTEVSAAAVC